MLTLHHDQLLDWLKFRYDADSILRLTQFLDQQGTFQFPTLDNGLFPAALLNETTDYTGYGNVWVRDNIYLAYAHSQLGKGKVAVKTLATLMTFFKQSRHRFEAIIQGQVSPEAIMQRPHIRFNGQTLQELDQQWSHAQNDALGYFLWFYCQLACDRQLTPQPEEIEVLLLFSRYFEAIQYWQDEDNGHWEEARKIEASSIGAVVAGLRSLQQMLRQFNLEQPTKLTSLIEAGTQALQQILPAECIQPEPQARRYDAALLFLIYPLQVVTGDMAEQIVADVVQHLKGDYGIRRYLGDSFWAPDYRTKLTPEARTADVSEDMSARDALVQIGEEAQWCIFDPIISILYGLKFQQTGQSLALELQTHYLNRALGQLTGPDCSLGAWRCPELYFKEGGCYQPNDATPLLWTQANLRLALKQMATSCA